MERNNTAHILKVNDDNQTVTFDKEGLQAILTHSTVKDKHVSVISIVGPFRQGKSFFLNFVYRYLRHKYHEKQDILEWLKNEDGPLLNNFGAASGSKRHTNGITMCREVFFAKRRSGPDVAILLLDTQGSFDNESDINTCAQIFAVSSLISSVQIYNLQETIKQYDLSHLKLFGDYANLVAEDGSPFQDLWFLIRDWSFPWEHAYGKEGGANYLNQTFEKNEFVREDVETIKRLFKNIGCFLMPNPGEQVKCNQEIVSDLDVIDVDFKKHIQEFVVKLLSAENLVVKTVNGVKVTAGDLCVYFQEFGKKVTEPSGDSPKLETIFKASVTVQHKLAAEKALKFYKKNMDIEVKHSAASLKSNKLQDTHFRNKNKAFHLFYFEKKIIDDATYRTFSNHLKKNINDAYLKYRNLNEEKQIKEEMDRVFKSASGSKEGAAGGSGLQTMSTGEKIALGAAVVGGAAALLFGGFKAFSSTRNNN